MVRHVEYLEDRCADCMTVIDEWQCDATGFFCFVCENYVRELV